MTTLNRYIWLVDTLVRAGQKGLTFEEINDKYRYNDSISNGGEYALRTFHDHRKSVEELFGIEIACNRSDNRYYIRDTDDIKSPGYFRKWLLETISLNNTIAANDRLRDRILLEDVPSTTPALIPLLAALRENIMVNFQYHPFDKDVVNPYNDFQPWTLKMYKRRWYVYGSVPEKGMRIFSLDRISDVEPTGQTFQLPEDFDAEAVFFGTFGAYVTVKDQPQTILIKTDEWQAKYLRSLPLHKSQEEVERTPEYTIFSLFVKPTYDLKQEILTMNIHAEVLAPVAFREEIQANLSEMLNKYNRPEPQ
ncbi:MAG: WYL domain-containing protein [Bacteroidales bacterium]|nr:WYL domain-containing protein [Bacteroidales bacterium]